MVLFVPYERSFHLLSDNLKAASKASGPPVIEKGVKADSRDENVKSGSLNEKTTQNQPSIEARPKEGIVCNINILSFLFGYSILLSFYF